MFEEELSSKTKAGIYRGLLDCHLGRMFNHKEVFSRNPYYILRVKIKKIYWRLRQPFYHRNCAICKKYLQDIKAFEAEK